MRVMVVLLIAGCVGAAPSRPDAAADANSAAAPIGTTCRSTESQLCADGAGWCFSPTSRPEGICRSFCVLIVGQAPTCPSGGAPAFGDGQVCVCIPVQ